MSKTTEQLLNEDVRKKAALLHIRNLLPRFGRKLDREVSSHMRKSNVPTFAAFADELAALLGPSAKA